jgi:hypothetical protein
MNDLKILRDAWGQPDPPSPAAHRAARAALLAWAADTAQVTRPSRRRRARWVAGGLALAAAATAAAVALAVTTVPTVPVGRAAVNLSARQILLTAAASAAARPAALGKYWYVKMLIKGSPTEVDQTWTDHHGQTWIREGTGNPVSKTDPTMGFWPLGDTHITLKQIQRIPTTPAAFKAWLSKLIIGNINKADAAAGKHLRLSIEQADPYIGLPLADFLYRVPASPQVRAAAFRVLAMFPGIKRAGTVDGVPALLLPTGGFTVVRNGKSHPGVTYLKLVLDPSTSRVVSVIYPAFGGGIKGITTVITAKWTNHRPRVGSQN